MDIQAMTQHLSATHGLGNVEQMRADDQSTTFHAANSWGTDAAAVEVFSTPVAENDRAGIAHLAQIARSAQHPAVARVRECGLTDDGHLFVVRDSPQGKTLAELIEGRRDWDAPFTFAETRSLMGPVAEAIDQFNSNNTGSFLARSIEPREIVMPAGNNRTAVLRRVGPAVGHVRDVADRNVRAFAEVVAAMLGSSVDEKVYDATSGAIGYLKGVFDEPRQPRGNGAATSARAGATAPEPTPSASASRPRSGPQQHFPSTDPGFTAVGPDQYRASRQSGVQNPAFSHPSATGGARSSSRLWPWIIGAVVVIALIGGVAGLFVTNGGSTGEEWAMKESSVAEDFPGLIADTDGGRGFAGLTCSSAETEAGQQAKVRCADSDFGVSIVDYGSAESRDNALPDVDSYVVLGAETCEIESYEVSGQSLPTYILAPQGQKAQYLLLANGQDAEQRRLGLPIC